MERAAGLGEVCCQREREFAVIMVVGLGGSGTRFCGVREPLTPPGNVDEQLVSRF